MELINKRIHTPTEACYIFKVSVFSRFIHFVACFSLLLFFYCEIIFYSMDISHFIHLFIILWTFEWIFHFWAIMNNATINTDIQDFVWNLFFIFLVSEIAGSYGNSMFNLLKNDHQTVFQNGWTIFYSHQQWKKFQFSHILPTLVIMEKAMAPHSSTLAWKIPWTEEPGRLQSVRSPRVQHDWATSLSLFTFMHWRRKWQPTPVFLPGESQGRGSLVGCSLWGHTELDMTEVT